MSAAIAYPQSTPPALPEVTEGLYYEIIDGQRVERNMSKAAITLASVLLGHLFIYLRPRKLGVAVAEQTFRLAPPPAKLLRPDVAVVSYDRWTETTLGSDDPWVVVPNLAAEVISPTNRSEEVLVKVDEYQAAGVGLVWVIYPESPRVYVYDRESPSLIRVVGLKDELDGGKVLPGFKLTLSDLFEPLTKPAP